jgi:hypothetical protein
MFLQRSLHCELKFGFDLAARDERWGQMYRLARHRAIEMNGVIDGLLELRTPFSLAHQATICEREYRFQAARNIVCEQADASGRSDCSQVAVADTVPGDSCAYILREPACEFRPQVRLGLEGREGPSFLRKPDLSAIRAMADFLHDVRCQAQRC